MRGAALFAGLTLNAAFVMYAAWGAWRWADPFTLVVGPLVWGLFLLLGIYFVPARLGMSARDLVRAQFGETAATLVYWVWLPVWMVSVYADLAMWFRQAIEHAELENAMWGWVILTALPGQGRFLVRVSAVVLLAAPIGYREEWPEIVQFLPGPACCEGIWEMQSLVSWMAPALLLAGERRREGKSVLGAGLLGVVLPLVVVPVAGFFTVAGGAATYGPRISKTGNYLSALVATGPAASVKWVLAALTLVFAGRFFLDLLAERLGGWRRWWLVIPLGWAAAYWGRPLEWAYGAAPVFALAGVMSAGYHSRREFVFLPSERRIALAAWAGGYAVSVTALLLDTAHEPRNTAPALAWLAGFALFGGFLWSRRNRNPI